MDKMGSNHSFHKMVIYDQRPRNPRKITQGAGRDCVQTTTMVKYQSRGESTMPLTRVPVHLTPASSDIGVPTRVAPPSELL